MQKLVFGTYLPDLGHKRMKIGRITQRFVLNPLELLFIGIYAYCFVRMSERNLR